MAIKKSEAEQIDVIARALKLLDYDANKNTITHLFGRQIAQRLEYQNSNSRRGVGVWLEMKPAMLLSNVVVNLAIHIFGYDPQRPEDSTRDMDFNALIELLINTGYTPDIYPLKLNKIVEVLNGMSEADYKDYCLTCNKPYIHAPSDFDACPTCMAKKCKVATMRYSQAVVPVDKQSF